MSPPLDGIGAAVMCQDHFDHQHVPPVQAYQTLCNLNGHLPLKRHYFHNNYDEFVVRWEGRMPQGKDPWCADVADYVNY